MIFSRGREPNSHQFLVRLVPLGRLLRDRRFWQVEQRGRSNEGWDVGRDSHGLRKSAYQNDQKAYLS